MSEHTAKTDSYDLMSRLNHWGIALLMIGMLLFGFYITMIAPQGPGKGALFGLHKSIGLVVLLLGAWRVIWRLKQGFKEDVGAPPRWQSLIARATHLVLLAGILVMPVSGMIGNYFSGRAFSPFGLFLMPSGEKIEALSRAAYGLHGLFSLVMVGAIALHVAGALKHHFIDRDTTFSRMVGRT